MHPLLKIREQILQQIRPTLQEVEKGQRVFNKIQFAIQETAQEHKVNLAFVQLEGSAGRKQTQLRDSRELDVFIGLPLSMLPRVQKSPTRRKSPLQKMLTDLVRNIAMKAAKRVSCEDIEIAYAEHPYLTATLDNFQIDLVFCFDIPRHILLERGPITAVDRTPHHSIFIDENLSEEQRDDVRLLKAFFKSNFVYGDASPIGRTGFTGFSTEMIIYHWKNVIEAFQGLRQLHSKPLDSFHRSEDTLKELFKRDLLIIVDPTDSKRNVAASISERSYRYAQHLAEEIIQKPTPHLFLPKIIPMLTKKEMDEITPSYLILEFHDKTGWHYTKTRDKLYRYFSHLCEFLKNEQTGEERFGNSIFEEIFEKKVFAIALRVSKSQISPSYFRIGPPSHLKEAVHRFQKKHPNAILRNGRYEVEIQRAFTSPEEAIHQYLKDHPLTQKLHLLGVTQTGTTKTGNQALWILLNAVEPFSEEKKW